MLYQADYEEEIVKYLPFVKRVVSRIEIRSTDYDRDDLFNIGVIGLMDALKKYDVSKNANFESYAYIRIRGAVIDEIRKTSRVSRTRMEALDAFYKAKEKLERDKMKSATDQEICDELGINKKQLSKIHETVHYLANISLENTIFTSTGESLELKDTIEDKETIPFDLMMLEDEKKDALIKCIDKLAERERIILNLYYVEELTLKEIAEVLDISIPRVSQIHGKVLIKLKKLIEEELK